VSGPAEGRPRRPVDGLLLLDKPSGITSNAALQKVKWLYRARKAGHTGSLDPLASGMLPICLGEATKFAGYLLDADKAYRVQACLGIATDTADAEGKPVARHSRPPPTPGELETAMARLRGPIRQVPPMYSALKQGGQRLYELARAGREVRREAREVCIREFVLEAYDPERPAFRVRCSKGTYIRTLVEDLARELGTVAHVIALRRLWVAPFADRAMHTLPELEALAAAGTASLEALDARLEPIEAALPDWAVLRLDSALAARLAQGGAVPAGSPATAGPVRFHGPDGRFLGIGAVGPDGIARPRRLLALGGVPAGGGLAAGL
jgi:tRNA pseudouridine55 synthase